MWWDGRSRIRGIWGPSVAGRPGACRRLGRVMRRAWNHRSLVPAKRGSARAARARSWGRPWWPGGCGNPSWSGPGGVECRLLGRCCEGTDVAAVPPPPTPLGAGGGKMRETGVRIAGSRRRWPGTVGVPDARGSRESAEWGGGGGHPSSSVLAREGQGVIHRFADQSLDVGCPPLGTLRPPVEARFPERSPPLGQSPKPAWPPPLEKKGTVPPRWWGVLPPTAPPATHTRVRPWDKHPRWLSGMAPPPGTVAASGGGSPSPSQYPLWWRLAVGADLGRGGLALRGGPGDARVGWSSSPSSSGSSAHRMPASNIIPDQFSRGGAGPGVGAGPPRPEAINLLGRRRVGAAVGFGLLLVVGVGGHPTLEEADGGGGCAPGLWGAETSRMIGHGGVPSSAPPGSFLTAFLGSLWGCWILRAQFFGA